jgi:Prolyl oligopeptidase, N-terminal beta-propeller domain
MPKGGTVPGMISRPPATRSEPVTEILHGVPVTDPFRWLEEQHSPRTREWIAEQSGFRSAAETRIPACDLVWMRSTAFRLIRKGMQEPWRGTLCTVGNESYLFTMGYVSWWDEYPGPHIPAPLEIGSCGSTDIRERARELLALTKMNWNSSEGLGRYPITISFARKVGTLMTELPDNQTPNPSYRFYM